MSLYPSYLGQVVKAGLRLGYRPADFGLEHIMVGGEVVTNGLNERCRRLFGPLTFLEGYAMTETIPFGGSPCSEGHLHFEASHGLLEVIDTETGKPAAGDEPGTIVATPFAPYRETTILLRYDTEDVVRHWQHRSPATYITCPWPPATCWASYGCGCGTRPPGPSLAMCWRRWRASKRSHCRRCGFWAVPRGVAVEVATRGGDLPAVRRVIEDQLEARHVPLREMHLREHPGELQHPLPLRCDLRATSFQGGPAEWLSSQTLLGART